VVDTLWLHRGIWGEQMIWGCAFKHVVVRGRIQGAIRFAPSRQWWSSWPQGPGPTDPFVLANNRFYEDVDWALDISGAAFTGIEMELSGIPSRLIRRDRETQVVITRERILGAGWTWNEGDIVTNPRYWSIKKFMDAGFADAVLVAPKANKKFFAQDLGALRALREEGLAEPD